MQNQKSMAGSVRRGRRVSRVAQAVECESLELRRLLSTVYVDLNSAGPTHDGTSWATAFTDLQPVLQAAVSGETIDVAQGTYYPTSGINRAATFQLVSGVEIDGGFAGVANPTAARNVSAYPTILSGDIGIAGSVTDNSYHIVNSNGVTAAAILDGFTITRGYANGGGTNQSNGGGLLNLGSPTIRNCSFTGNIATDGGGIYSSASSSTFTNCVFAANSASQEGGGVFIATSSPNFDNCTFNANMASTGGAVGGGAKLNNCILWGDFASSFGNEFYDSISSTVTYGDIDGSYTGTHNINVDPLFLHAAGGNLALQPTSPCINAGNSAAVPAGITTDLAGNPRIADGSVDMGAYEVQGALAPFFKTLNHATFENSIADSFTIATVGFPVAALSVSGSLPAGVTFNDNGDGTATISGTPSGVQTYNLAITASNGVSPSVTQSFTLVVAAPLQPAFTSAAIAQFNANAQNSFTIATTAVPSPVLTISGGNLPQGVGFMDNGDGTATVSGVPPFASIGFTFSLIWKAANGVGSNATQSFSLTIVGTQYVDSNAPGPIQNGLSWATAYKSLQSVLPNAAIGTTIDVAQGIYYPTMVTDRTATFQLKNGVEIDGGFAGAANPAAARNIAAYPTILSGDIGVKGNIADDSYHVVTGSGVNSTAILDGFTVTGGNANGTLATYQDSGGGLVFTSSSGSPVVRNCVFSANAATGTQNIGHGGGAVGIFGSASPSFANCTFINNSATGRGGGIVIYQATATITGCVFVRNSSTSQALGGGIYILLSTATLSGCSFDGNFGGAIYNDISGQFAITNCVFVGNSGANGGAIYYSTSSNFPSTLTNCTFAGNFGVSGNAIYDSNGVYPAIRNCIFWDGGGLGGELRVVNPNSQKAVSYSDVEGGFTGTGNINSDPHFLRNPSPGPDGVWGTVDDDYGNLAIQPDSPVVDAGNNAAVPAGITTDFAGNSRFQDVPTSPHIGLGTVPIVDMGAYEAAGILSADAGGPYIAVAGQTVALRGVGASNIAGPLQYAWDFSGSGLFNDATGANPTFSTAGYAAGTSITVSLRVTDAGSNSVIAMATIIIKAPLLYVDTGATGTGDGSSWANAYTNLQTAMAGAAVLEANSPAMPVQIEVAQGVYYPSANALRGATFNLLDDVEIDGGFLGAANPTAARNISAYPTILSGDIGVKGYLYDNSATVVMASGVDGTAILDGVTITGGYGGTKVNGTFTGGAGILDVSANPTIRNCTITGNTSAVFSDGGGMFNYSSSPSLTNCIFSGNLGSFGGGVFDNFHSSPTFTNCILVGNLSAMGPGGGMVNFANCSPTLINCTFASNSTTGSGDSGGALCDESVSDPTLTNCIFWGDFATVSGEIFSDSSSTQMISNSDIQGGFTGSGNITFNPDFNRNPNPGPDGVWTTSDDDYGNLQLQPGSPCINAGSNAAVPAGITTDIAGSPRITFGTVDIGAYEYQGIAWTGNGDEHSFSDGNNWAGGVVPGAHDIVSIPAGASVEVTGTGSTVALGGVFMTTGALFDLGNNPLTINFTGSDPVSTLRGYLHSACNNGDWTGATGLTSSAVEAQVAANKGTTKGLWSIGYADGNLDGAVGGAALNQIIISPQLVADGNEDGKVDFNDLLALAQNIGSPAADWVHSDFNFDGVVDMNDLLLLAQNTNKTNGNTPLAGELPADSTIKATIAVNPLFSSVPIMGSSAALQAVTDDVLKRRDQDVM